MCIRDRHIYVPIYVFMDACRCCWSPQPLRVRARPLFLSRPRTQQLPQKDRALPPSPDNRDRTTERTTTAWYNPKVVTANLCATVNSAGVTSHGASRACSFSGHLLLFSSRFFIVLLFFRAGFVLREQTHLQSSARGYIYICM